MNYEHLFIELVQAGLWKKNVCLSAYGEVDFAEVYQLASEQSVVGLTAAGIGHIKDVKVPRTATLPFMGVVLQLEHRNKAMNAFIADLTRDLQDAGIEFLLVKGQGIAQCYEKPLWRACGDVDMLLDASNYERAKKFLMPRASAIEDEDKQRLHLGLTIDSWVVELHGTLHTRQMPNINKLVDTVQKNVFEHHQFRTWKDGQTDILLPSPDADVIFVFTHILQHFFGGGIGLRQICDWCRLLWTYRDSLDIRLLEVRLRKSGLMTEWKAFATLAVEWLGMPAEAMPLYEPSGRWSGKAKRILRYVLETGNFGHNRDNSFRQKAFVVRSAVSAWRYTSDTMNHFLVFPWDSVKVWWRMFLRMFHIIKKECQK